ncbi:MAG TPA: 5-dehydro-2-deoxygluconokinase [Nitrososphaerales archaeon]|nr:5-dehydro-2-deoxygluconokinase [Nitrososphaerales archaeon]
MTQLLDMVAIGRAGVDLYSLDLGAPLESAKRFAKYVGGTAANTVVGASRLGLRAALVTRVSDDELGRFVKGFLENEGVDVSHVAVDRNARTGIVFAEVSPGRDGKFIFYREKAADLLVTRRDAPKSLVGEARALLVTGTGLTKEPSYHTLLGAAKDAGDAGREVVFNLDWRPSLWNVPLKTRVSRYRRMMKLSDVTIGNQGEYIAATGAPDLESALGVVGKEGPETLVVTSGDKGSEVRKNGKVANVPGFKVPLVKGLGGGDGFIAGYLFGRLKGWGDEEAAVFGNAVGAIVVTGHACSESMPRLGEVRTFLASQGYALEDQTGPFKR